MNFYEGWGSSGEYRCHTRRSYTYLHRTQLRLTAEHHPNRPPTTPRLAITTDMSTRPHPRTRHRTRTRTDTETETDAEATPTTPTTRSGIGDSSATATERSAAARVQSMFSSRNTARLENLVDEYNAAFVDAAESA